MRHVLVLCALAAVGCAEARTPPSGDSPAESSSVRDSAGITIRTDPTAVRDLPVFATVAADPSVVIGLDEASPSELFIGVGDIATHPDHGIAIADPRSLDVRVFDWAGRYRLTVGGPGEGPGEFGRVSTIEADSTLWVWDGRRGRASRFNWDGDLLSELGVSTEGMPWGGILAFTPSGHAVVGRHVVENVDELGYHLWPIPLDVSVADPSGSEVPLGRVPATEWVAHLTEISGGPPGMRVHGSLLRPLGGVRFLETLGDSILLARGDSPELALYGTDAVLREIWRLPGLVEPATAEFIDRWGAVYSTRLLAQLDTPNAQVHAPRALSEFPPETLPAFVDLVVSDTGDLWLAAVSADDLRTWVVVSRDGAYRGRVELPSEWDVRAVSEQHVVAVSVGPLGVEHVRIFDLLSAM